MKRTKLVAALAAALAWASAAAHEKGGDRAMGVVESIATDRIVVKTADGHPVAFAITPETRFFKGDDPARAEDVKVGQRAVVRGERAGETLRAVQVRLGPETRRR